MNAPAIEQLDVAVYTVPTRTPESDGTLDWDATTAVVVTLHADGCEGLGWTYSTPAAAAVVQRHLGDVVRGRTASDIAAGWEAMHRAGRNFGTRGIWMQAMSAIDIAWWDLAARLRDRSLSDLFGRCRDAVPVYGSGGFTNFSDAELAEHVRWWTSAGCTSMKIKIGERRGADVDRDLARVERLRELAGPGVALMVDANGAYSVGPARRVGAALDDLGVTWFEEPVSSDDIQGLGTVRSALRCDVAAGEYAADVFDVARLLPVVDCLQLDVTRCGGYTGWFRGVALAAARNLEVSAHCAPSLHAPVAAATPNLRHVEWFADHAVLEPRLFTGTPAVDHGVLAIDTATGHGLAVARSATSFRIA